MAKPFNRPRRVENPDIKILFQVFTDGAKIGVHDVYAETENHFRCFSAWGPSLYDVSKKRAWRDREDLKYLRWARRVNEKPSPARYKFINNTTHKKFKNRYIRDFPEKLI